MMESNLNCEKKNIFYYAQEGWLILLFSLYLIGYMSVKSSINFSLHFFLCKIQI